MSINEHRASVEAVREALSAARMGTYERAVGGGREYNPTALVLYAWNADVSGALLPPLHVCEVVIRNAVSDALAAVYGERWPWSMTCERSLPDPVYGYSPRRDLQSARRSAITAGKVIPELKFVFWQKMFTSRYDTRIWALHLRRVMPNLDAEQEVSGLRQAIYRDLEQVRLLRNRIAHHEPIFSRDLSDDLKKIFDLVAGRCVLTAKWLCCNQRADAVIAARPGILPHGVLVSGQ